MMMKIRKNNLIKSTELGFLLVSGGYDNFINIWESNFDKSIS